jgi:hypothetical protein
MGSVMAMYGETDAMANTVQRALTLLHWKQQQQQQQQAAGSSSDVDSITDPGVAEIPLCAWKLPVECLLLQPNAEMATSCLQLFMKLTQLSNVDSAARSAAAEEGHLRQAVAAALRDLGPAVYYVAQQVDNLKQRRQLMRQWAGALQALLQVPNGEWCCTCAALHANAKGYTCAAMCISVMWQWTMYWQTAADAIGVSVNYSALQGYAHAKSHRLHVCFSDVPCDCLLSVHFRRCRSSSCSPLIP